MDWIISRLKEPSTWAGIAAAIGGMTFIPNAATVAQVVAAVGVGVAGVLAVLFKEKSA